MKKLAVWMAAAVLGAAALAGRGHAPEAREGEGDVERRLREEWGFQCGMPDAEAWEAAVEASKEEAAQAEKAKREARVFPEWKPEDAAADSGKGLEAELRALVAQGRRDRAASPEFLEALEGVLDRHAGEGEKASDQLPLKPAFRGPGMPAGWRAVDSSVWRFGDGEARQVESKANTRYVLFYEPGMAWRDYAVTLRFESDRWFPPPANSCAAVWVRYKGVDDAYSVNFDGNGNVSVISCEEGGKGRVIVRTAAGAEVIKDGKPWTVLARGEEIVVEHEGRRYLEVHDGTHREGTVGLESIHIPMAFSGVEVK